MTPDDSAPSKDGRKKTTPQSRVLAKVARSPAGSRREERRQAIIEAAAGLFAELGFADCEMERVASTLQIAKGTLYLYFPGKQELFFACVDYGMSQMQCAVRAAATTEGDPFERIGRAVRAYLIFFEDHPQYVELLLQERAIFKDRKRSTYFEYRDSNRGFWRELYAGLIASGRLRDDIPVDHMLDVIGNLLYGTMFTNHFVGRSTSSDEQFAALMEAIFRGLLSEADRALWKLPASPASPSSQLTDPPAACPNDRPIEPAGRPASDDS